MTPSYRLPRRSGRSLPVPLLGLSVCLAGLLTVLLPVPSRATDDRALFQSVNANPYVFIIMDISGSMTWRSDNGNRTVHGMDDPESRIYQAKRAIYQVLEDPSIGDSLRYGWATFDRGNRAKLVRKRWIYTPAEDPPWYPYLPIFGAGDPITFGDPLDEDDREIAGRDQNYFSSPPGIWTYRRCGDETGRESRIHDFPKLDGNGAPFTILYYQHGGNDYRIIFHPLGAAANLGDPEIRVRIRIDQRYGGCRQENSGSFNGQYFLRHNVVVPMVPMITDDGLDPALALEPFPDVIGNGYGLGFRSFTYDDYETSSTCSGDGWESNLDSDAEDLNPLSYDREVDPLGRGAALARGDVIPWDWDDGAFDTNGREEILHRLAPNLTAGETVPDFRAARYWDRSRNAEGELQLRPEFAGNPPIMPNGNTPLGHSLDAFGDWFDDWWPAALDEDTGDDRYQCRQRYVVLLTDGEDTCDPDPGDEHYPCDVATRLRRQGNRVFVVGYAFAGDRSTLQCIADNGGTGAIDYEDEDDEPDGPGPIFVDSPEELVDRLKEVFVTIQSEATTVSAAAVPSVQVDVSDRLFLTEFLPLENEAVWPGRLDAFVAPLPTSSDGLPNRGARCVDSFDSGCLAWEAQDVLVNRQYDPVDPVGNEAFRRRIYYSEFSEATENADGPVAPGGAVPAQRRFWRPVPDDGSVPDAVRSDLARGLGLDPLAAGIRNSINEVIDSHLSLRTETLPDGTVVDYLLGDIFHSDPLLLQSPSNATYLAMDLMGDPDVDCEQGDPDSYRCFALFHEHRRKAIAVGSNDGMLHLFDAGIFHRDPGGVDENPAHEGRFDNGTGRELFAYMPRVVMPTVRDLAVEQPRRHQFTVDGSPVAADVFIDPAHSGVGSLAPPSAADREWRTVLMGGLRRGGGHSTELIDPEGLDPLVSQRASGYYALDVTQPDPVVGLDSYGDEAPDADLDADTWIPSVTDTEAPPACLADADGSSLPLACGPVPYGAPLWEFNDTLSGQTADGEDAEGVRLDEDDNGWIDLAATWSTPVIGRILVCGGTTCTRTSAGLEDRFVAVFGGGYDSEAPHVRGNFLYMVDVETGTTLYKRRVYGSLPSRPVVQMSLDGYIERIYFATTLGLLYRLDLLPEIGGTVRVPRIVTGTVTERSSQHTGSLAVGVERIWDDEFEPVILFNASGEPLADVVNGVAADPRPIFLEPTLVYVQERNANALLFGTGNRDDLFLREQPSGRFFAFVDDLSADDLRAADFETFGPGDLVDTTLTPDNADILLDPDERGWWLDLDADERLVGRPFVISGVLFFSTYTPLVPDDSSGEVCQEQGFSRVYGLFTASSNPLLAEDGGFVRSRRLEGLVTKPFAVPYQTQNKPKAGAGDPLTDEQVKIFEELKKLFPSLCRFPPGMRLDVNVRSENTGLQRVASVPICVVESAFKEGR